MVDYQEEMKKLFDHETVQTNLKKLYDVDAMQEYLKKFYDVEQLQESLKTLYNVDELKENLGKLYDFEGAQEQLKQFYDADAAQEFLSKLLDQDFINQVKGTFENALDADAINDAVKKAMEASSTMAATNSQVVSDAVILQANRAKASLDGFLQQVDALVKTKDLNSALELQKAYGEELRENLKDLAWMNVGMIANAFETNAELIKDSVASSKK